MRTRDGILCAGALAIAGALFAYSALPADYELPPVPGSINPAVTQSNIKETICNPDWVREQRPDYAFSNARKRWLLGQKHLPLSAIRDYELDHLVPLCLGGAPTDSDNLWLQRWAEARVKDKAEALACRAVCAGEILLIDAQVNMAHDWPAFYQKLK